LCLIGNRQCRKLEVHAIRPERMAEIVRELAYAADAVSARILLQRMRKMPFNRRRQSMFPGFLLAMLLLRAYVPVGFMPGSGAPLVLDICPVGLPTQMLAHHLHHHPGAHDHFENCPFGSAPAAGPISHLIDFEPAGQLLSQSVAAYEPLRLDARLRRAHQSRGPPFLA